MTYHLKNLPYQVDEEDYDIWSNEYYDEYEYENEEDARENAVSQRINFKKYSEKYNTTEPDDDLPSNIYCDLVNTLNSKCKEVTILDIWRFKKDLVETTTQQEIIDAVNFLERSPWFGYNRNYSSTLGGITRNSTGHIVSAKSDFMVFFIEYDDENVDVNKGGGSEWEFVDNVTLAWEAEFIQIGLNSSDENLKVMVEAKRSFGDISDETMFVDGKLVVIGYLIMIVFTIIMLGNVQKCEMHLMLTIGGIITIVMGMIIGVGLSSLIGYYYTPVHVILPFLCLGKR